MNDAVAPTPTEQGPATTLIALDSAPPAAAPSAGWTTLDQRGLLHVTGPDAESFLQGQLTQDLARVRAGHALLAAHCTPKGRISTLFRVWPANEGFLLDCPAAMQAQAAKRLRLYVLRAKVVITEVASAWHRCAVFGPQAAQWLDALQLPVPTASTASGTLAARDGYQVLALPEARWLVLGTPDTAALPAALAAASGQPEDAAGWALANLRAGEPEVWPASSEAFIPQMLNLDQLDGISFRKGCYTGQEIVARSHYLGKVKRRMQRVAWLGSAAPQPGQSVPWAGTLPANLPTHDDAPAAAPPASQGEVVLAVATHPGGGEALAVLRVDEAGDPAARSAD